MLEGPHLEGKIFVTGGAGFLGRALIRRAQREKWPCSFTIYSRDEEKQWALQNKYGSHIRCYLGDVRDYQSLTSLMPGHDLVIHAAAIKFIPEAERNVWETIKVNIDGSRNIVRAAAYSNVPKVIAISTDKACQPTNVYGMSKAIMEKLVAESNRWREKTLFGCVRYGNVIGSTGSIIPVFKKQLERSKKLLVTDKEMTRFWLSADQAIDLIILAQRELPDMPGGVWVPRCGAMSIFGLAELIAEGAPIDIVGIRPGEKIHEDLIHHQESTRAEQRGDYFVLRNTLLRKGEGWTYRSSNPSRWIPAEEMSKMIVDAENI